jgi:hypothetical protein
MKKALVALWGLNVFDLLCTWYAVQVTGYAVEVNPFMSWAMNHGLGVFALVKLGLFVLPTVAFLHIHKRKPRAVTVAVYVLLGLYGLIALDHIVGFVFMRSN